MKSDKLKKMALGLVVGIWTGIVAGNVAAQEITLRHALDGKAQSALATLVVRFNDELKDKGRVVLQDARSVEDKKHLPHLALLDADDSFDFFATRPRFLPLHQMLRETGRKIDSSIFYPQVLDAVDDPAGRLQALPLGLSLPVLFINRSKLVEAKLDPEQRPHTWLEVQNLAGALYDKGIACPLTSSRFAWVHIENISSQYGEPMQARSGRNEKAIANNLVNVKHLALLASWQKSRYFHYFGPGAEGNQRFLSGECAMLTGESSLYAAARAAGLDFTIASLPYYDDVYGVQPQNVLPDGAALWVLPGHKKNEYVLAARFIEYLMRPEIQKEWVAATSYLPMTPPALNALRGSGIPDALLDAADRRLSVSLKGSTRTRPGPLRDRLRQFLGEEVAFVWNSDRAAKQALDTATARANAPVPTVASTAPAAKAAARSRQRPG
jgi:sn-glycerol 3-phosphate transport system substrate-binding protein